MKSGVIPWILSGIKARRALARGTKSRNLYQLLALFVGALGIHNFYAGYRRTATVQLVCTVLFFWTNVIPVLMAVWAFGELMSVTQDATGRRMR